MPFEIAHTKELLTSLTYPGRGVILGKSEDGASLAAVYFIMGRSENSRNRVFEAYGEDVTIYPADKSKVEDPRLIIYTPIRRVQDSLIVTNGDQTDTIRDYLEDGHSFEDALRARRFEPDAPNFTPRISGLLALDGTERYRLSILKAMDSEGMQCARFFYEYEAQNGLGHFIHTYERNENPLPSFAGEPRRVHIPDTAEEFADEIWTSLNAENKISMAVCYYDAAGKRTGFVMKNRFQKAD